MESIAQVIPGTLDRIAPVQFGEAKPLDRLYFPGSRIAVQFSEDVDCTKPFNFDVTVAVEGGSTYEKNSLVVVCTGSTIEVAFPVNTGADYAAAMGKQVTVSYGGVTDTTDNVISARVLESFIVAPLNLTGSYDTRLRGFSVKAGRARRDTLPPTNELDEAKDAVRAVIACVAAADTASIKVISTEADGDYHFDTTLHVSAADAFTEFVTACSDDAATTLEQYRSVCGSDAQSMLADLCDAAPDFQNKILEDFAAEQAAKSGPERCFESVKESIIASSSALRDAADDNEHGRALHDSSIVIAAIVVAMLGTALALLLAQRGQHHLLAAEIERLSESVEVKSARRGVTSV